MKKNENYYKGVPLWFLINFSTDNPPSFLEKVVEGGGLSVGNPSDILSKSNNTPNFFLIGITLKIKTEH